MREPTSLQALIGACLDAMAATHQLSPRQWQVCHHIRDCRTAAMGGELMRCDQCDLEQAHYHSCRDRHCPRCQHRQSQQWCARQQAAVLPLLYHHLLFTLPDTLNGWVEVHPREIYALLFETVWATLSQFATNRLDGQLGMTAVLHTWGLNANENSPICAKKTVPTECAEVDSAVEVGSRREAPASARFLGRADAGRERLGTGQGRLEGPGQQRSAPRSACVARGRRCRW